MHRNALPAIVALILGPPALAAQNVGGSATIEVPTLLRIEVVDPDVAFPLPGLQDFADGYVDAASAPPRVHTRGNVHHRVQVAAAATLLTSTAGAGKPIDHLQWSTDGLAWSPMSTEPADVAVLPPGRHPEAASLRFRMTLDLATDSPATYEVGLVFTAVAQ